MDLKTFVSETLTQIVEGIEDARKQLKAGGTNAAINPMVRSSAEARGADRPVEFDVAITVISESDASSAEKIGANAGIRGFLSVVGSLESGSKAAERNEAVSRVKFSVQLAQPADISVGHPVNARLKGI